MAAKFPCSNPPPLCEQQANPSTQYSSEAADSTTFIGLAWSNEVPRLGKPFDRYPCFEITESQISQLDADLEAARLVAACADPCALVYMNTAQTAAGQCPDDTLFFYTVAAGLFSASNQLLADRMAFTFAVKQLNAHRLCLSGLSAEICAGVEFSQNIRATGNYGPFMFSITSGTLPPGMVSENIIAGSITISGTPTIPGSYHFTVEVKDSAGSYMRKNYTIQVSGITTSSPLSDATVGTAYSQQLYALIFGSTAIWEITSGILPNGLNFDPDTGMISGVPVDAGSSTFTVTIGGCSKEFSATVQENTPPVDVCVDGVASLINNVYAIQGYVDGMFDNPIGTIGPAPNWDGVFHMKAAPPAFIDYSWVSGNAGDYNIISLQFCISTLALVECVAAVPNWYMNITGVGAETLWVGIKIGGQTPEGVYNRIGGDDATPPAATIVKIGGATSDATSVGCGI